MVSIWDRPERRRYHQAKRPDGLCIACNRPIVAGRLGRPPIVCRQHRQGWYRKQHRQYMHEVRLQNGEGYPYGWYKRPVKLHTADD
jgi:hypothetical protein